MGVISAIYVVGTAGCGKSTFCGAFSRYLVGNGLSSSIVNLDPGALDLPYEPNVDVREWLSLGEVMEEYGLGPNGAQVVCADLLALESKKIQDALGDVASQYVVLDTPGQLELFAFREASREIVSKLFPGRSFMVYLIDPFNSRTPSGLISQLTLCSLSGLRLGMPMVRAISKSDMMDPESVESLDRWTGYPDSLLEDAVLEAQSAESLSPQLAIELFKGIDNLGLISAIGRVSSSDGSGMDGIFRTVQNVYGAGEDPIPDLARPSEG